jgi:tripartite-type tricarboxylate transporter receptor subunit TctC
LATLRRSKLLTAALLAVAALAPAVAAAQTYPNRPIRLIIGYPPGGPTDIVGRTLAQKLGDMLGQNVLVDNRAGASGIVGNEIASKAAPDGYTLLVAPSTVTIQHTLYAKLPYDVTRDFTPVALVAGAPLLLVIHPSVPVKTVKELIAFARARPGQLNYASPGSGSANHLSGEMLKSMTGMQVTHVPYKGGAPAEVDLLGGHVTYMFNTIASALPHVRSGRLRALGVSSARRSHAAPEIPTIAEAGVPGFESGTWYGIVGPAGLPSSIVVRLNAEINKALETPDMKERMASLGLDPMGGTPERFSEFMRQEIVKWAKVVKESGARAD